VQQKYPDNNTKNLQKMQVTTQAAVCLFMTYFLQNELVILHEAYVSINKQIINSKLF